VLGRPDSGFDKAWVAIVLPRGGNAPHWLLLSFEDSQSMGSTPTARKSSQSDGDQERASANDF
jgi:hypothetical protein